MGGVLAAAHVAALEAAAEMRKQKRSYDGLEEAIYSLERFPRRAPIAPEGRKLGNPLRHLFYGRNPHIYRVLFEIDELHKSIHVLTIRQGARDS